MDEIIKRVSVAVERQRQAQSKRKPAVHAPLTAQALKKAEKKLGFKVPPTLARLYMELGDGGFGPSLGLLGIDGGHTDDGGMNAVGGYNAFRRPLKKGKPSPWPDAHLPVCYQGMLRVHGRRLHRRSVPGPLHRSCRLDSPRPIGFQAGSSAAGRVAQQVV
jgi:hypothetical protein